MADDLANDWGCNLICMGHNTGRKCKVGVVSVILANDQREGNFDNLIDKMTGSLFGLMKPTTNGSDANLYAVTSLMKGNIFRCLIACSSYVSGDSSPLQSWSTSEFKIISGPASIISLDVQRGLLLSKTICWPFHLVVLFSHCGGQK